MVRYVSLEQVSIDRDRYCRVTIAQYVPVVGLDNLL